MLSLNLADISLSIATLSVPGFQIPIEVILCVYGWFAYLPVSRLMAGTN